MKTLLLALTLLPALSTFAAEAPLTWGRAVETLKKNSVEYQAAEATYLSTQALETGARSGYFPSVAGSLNYDQTHLSETDSTAQVYSASVTLTQNLFAGLRDYYRSSQATANTRLAGEVFRETKAKITSDFVTAYQNLVTAQESLKLTESFIKRRQDNLRLVELRFEGGRENKGSVMLSQAYLEQAKYENLQARHALENAQLALAHFLGIDNAQIERVADAVPVSDPGPPPDFAALATRTPGYQQILATVDANIAGVGVARSAFLPSLSVTGSVGRNDDEFFPRNDRWSVGATLSIPLFDGGRDYSTLKSTAYTRDASAARRTSVDRVQMETLKDTFQQFVEAVEKLRVDESFQKAATLRAEIARSQYNNGLISFVDWDNIENDLINRQKNLVTSKKARVLSEAGWNQVRGEGVFP